MLSIDQVRQLENRVEKAVRKINSLTEENQHLSDENKMLQEQLASVQTRVSELERSVEAFKEEQGRIESGILSALDKLSAFEDTVMSEGAEGEGEGDNPYQEGNPENQYNEQTGNY